MQISFNTDSIMMQRESETISDFDLQALVDGEFDVITHARMMEKIKKTPHLRSRLEELFQQKIILQQWWGTIPPN